VESTGIRGGKWNYDGKISRPERASPKIHLLAASNYCNIFKCCKKFFFSSLYLYKNEILIENIVKY